MALKTAENVMRRPDARVFDRSMLAFTHEAVANILGGPSHLSFGDRNGAVLHARTSVELFEGIANAGREDVRAQDDLIAAYLAVGEILLEDRTKEALQTFQKAAAIGEKLVLDNPSNTQYRRHYAMGQMGVGESLHRLGKRQESLQQLTSALEMAKSLTNAAKDQISLIGEVGRIHRDIANVLLAAGDEKGSRENHGYALAATEELIRRAPKSLYFQREYADTLEALGRHYVTLSGRRPEYRAQASQWLRKSLAIWQDWTRRQIATPYAGVRERQITAFLASIDKM